MIEGEAYNVITNELRYFNFNKNSIAFEYLIYSIYIVTKDKKNIKNFNKNVYPEVARVYETKPQNVLWCISKLINIMYRATEESTINMYLGAYYKKRPSPKMFIIMIANNIFESQMLEISG